MFALIYSVVIDICRRPVVESTYIYNPRERTHRTENEYVAPINTPVYTEPSPTVTPLHRAPINTPVYTEPSPLPITHIITRSYTHHTPVIVQTTPIVQQQTIIIDKTPVPSYSNNYFPSPWSSYGKDTTTTTTTTTKTTINEQPSYSNADDDNTYKSVSYGTTKRR